MTKSKYKSENKWKELSKEDRMASSFSREKNKRKWDSFRLYMIIHSLRGQLKCDSWIINNLKIEHPEIAKKLIEKYEQKVGKMPKRKELKIKYIEDLNPNPKQFVGARAKELLEKLKKSSTVNAKEKRE